MLWQKQKEGSALVYVDILKDPRFDMRKCKHQMDVEFAQSNELNVSPKDDAISAKVRREGNDLYIRMGDLDAGILKYNKAILLAESGSENMGMCYANRAACFLKLKKYELCLRDILSAKKSGYPLRLFAKLKEREEKCLQEMKDSKKNGPQPIEAQLSFPPNEKNPDFASGIEVIQVSNGEKRTFTERNLKIGETVIIEEPFELVSEYPVDFYQCANCFKADASLIPCAKCAVAMFCSTECSEAGHEKFHDIECGINYRFMKTEALRRSVLRTIIVAIQTFGTIEALMAAIESFNKDKKINETVAAKRNYLKFFASRRETETLPHQQESALRAFVLSMHKILTTESILKYMFISTKNQRFLTHLILHHFYVVNRNAYCAYALAEHSYKAQLGIFHPRLSKVYANGIALDGMHMKHSCVPNVARIFVGKKIIYKTIRPIKSGEELFVSYMHPLTSLYSTDRRTKMMSADFPMKCECVSCTSNFPPFKKLGNDKLDKSLIKLLDLLEGLPQKYEKRVIGVDRAQLDKYEKAIVEHLQRMDDVHPTEATLKLQFLLLQIWGNLYAVCHQR